MPEPSHDKTGAKGLPKWRTLRDAIGGFSAPTTIAAANAAGGPQAHNWHVTRVLSPINMARLKHIRPGSTRDQIPDELRPACHRGRDKGFSNVYGRMSWDQVPVTITAGCTTLSKGRFGHPSEDRTISLREAAAIQTFPNDYVIDTPYMDYACGIIGNALPCDFAEIMAKACADALAANSK